MKNLAALIGLTFVAPKLEARLFPSIGNNLVCTGAKTSIRTISTKISKKTTSQELKAMGKLNPGSEALSDIKKIKLLRKANRYKLMAESTGLVFDEDDIWDMWYEAQGLENALLENQELTKAQLLRFKKIMKAGQTTIQQLEEQGILSELVSPQRKPRPRNPKE
jgi:hypothetical protein